jgi:hypothetical protein
MRFRSTVLLAALAIAPVCAERIKDSDECHVVDPRCQLTAWIVAAVVCTPVATTAMVAAAVILLGGGRRGEWRRASGGGRAEKKDAVVVGGEGGDGNDVDNIRASGIGDDSTVIASRQSLRGGDFRAQHSSEAMF